MVAKRSRRLLAAPVAAAMVVGVLVFLTPGVASAADVTTEAEFTDAWENSATAEIALANDITLTCDSGAPFRNSSTNIVVEGNGHILRQTCADHQVMSSQGSGSVTFLDITVTGGDATGATPGGAILADGDLTVENSTFTDNHAEFSGGALVANGTITVVNSTISNNTTGGNGGAIAGNNVDSKVVVINSTITGNSVTAPDIGGGGIAAADLTLIYSTVTGNSATRGSNVFIHQSTFVFRNSFGSVVADPQGGGTNCDFQGTPDVTSSGYNFSDDDSCLFTATGDVQNGGSPMLGGLAANGGPTLTMLPQSGSPLIDAIPAASCQADGASGITSDQRGITRPQGSGCDVGAVEAVLAAPPIAPPTPLPAAPRFTG